MRQQGPDTMSPSFSFNVDRERASLAAEDFAQFVKIIAVAGGRPADFKHSADRYDASGAVRALLREKSVATGDAVLADVDGVVSGFLESLRSASLFDATVGDMLQAPMNTNVVAAVSMSADTTDESDPIPVATVALDGGTLKYRKCAGFLAISNEVMRFAPRHAVHLGKTACRHADRERCDGFPRNVAHRRHDCEYPRARFRCHARFDASQIAGNPGSADASTTNAANLTVPDDSSPPEPVTVSAFQKNLIGIKVVRGFGFSPMRDDIAASLANVAWKAEASA
jgi:hypothetical protein